MAKSVPRFRIIGSLIPRLQGREVCILGKALSVESSGQSLLLECADGAKVKCNLMSPLTVSPENCVVEIQGTVNEAQDINATAEPIIFSREASSRFDMDSYAYAVNLTVTFDGLYMQSPEE